MGRHWNRCCGTLLGGVLISAALMGCEPAFQAPNLYSVDKDWIDNDQEHTIRLIGDGFYPQIRVTNDDSLQVNQQFHAWLVRDTQQVELTVSPTDDYESLSAAVPAGLEPGRYDILLHTPTGQVDRLREGLLIVETAADRIVFSPLSDIYPADTPVTIDLSVLNTEGQTLDGDFPLVISVTDRDGSALEDGAVRFLGTTSADGGLAEQRSLSDGNGIQGVLTDGQGHFTLSVQDAGSYTFTATPSGEVPFLARDDVSGTMELGFSPAEIGGLTLSLSDASPATAGDEREATLTLLDADGAPSSYPLPLRFWITEQCTNTQGGFSSLVTLPAAASSVPLTVRPHVASGPGCDANGFTATLTNTDDAGGQELTASTQALTVGAGAPAALVVLATYTDELEAGDPARLALSLRDQYANAITDTTATPAFEGSIEGPASGTCSAWSAGQALCEVVLYRAGGDVTLTASLAGLSATSAPMLVRPGPPDQLSLYTDNNTSEAGQPRPFFLSVFDQYSNPAEIPEDKGAPAFTRDGTSIDCAQAAASVGNAAYDCVLTQAGESVMLDVALGGVSATSPAFTIINSELSHVAVSSPGDVRAGEAFSVRLTATDSYGNPFIETLGGSSTIELYDDSGDLSEQLELSEGTAEVSSLRLTTAWDDNTLSVYQGGRWLGQSESFDVDVADMAGFEVLLAQTWATTDEPLSVDVRAVDDYGNTVDDYTPTAAGVQLRADGGSGDTRTLRTFTAGLAETTFSFDAVSLGEHLIAAVGALSGESDTLDVATGRCAVEPTAVLTVNGDAPATLCLSGGSTDRVDLSATGSSAGAHVLSAWHFNDGVSGWARSLSSITTSSWVREGRYDTELVVIDAAGCYDTASTRVYISEDNGEPAGPISITADRTSLAADNHSASGVTSLSIAATDCAGLAAAAEPLLLRADIGALASGSSTLSAGGGGLFVTLDAYGEADLDWGVGGQSFANIDGTVYIGREDGAAEGSLSLPIIGDAVLPFVTAVSPAGTFSLKTETITVTFSEPISEETVSDSTISVLDPDDQPVSILDYEVDEETVTVTLATELDPADGAWTLLIDAGLMDPDGNALSGDASGSAADFSLAFGGVSDNAPDISACSSDLTTFRPDGDDGPNEDSDEVELLFSADAPASWWRLVIADGDGDVVLTTLEDAGGSSRGSWMWSGADATGRILPNGTYTITIEPRDDAWNVGSSCSVSVSIDNQL